MWLWDNACTLLLGAGMDIWEADKLSRDGADREHNHTTDSESVGRNLHPAYSL